MKPTPANLDAEEGFLACCILDESGSIIADALEAGIRADYFFKPAHQAIFEAVCAVQRAANPLDEIAVCAALQKSGQLDAAGGHADINRITNKIETTAHSRYWLELVREQAVKRKLIAAAQTLAEKATQGTSDLAALLSEMESQAANLTAANEAEKDAEPRESASQARRTAKLLRKARLHAFDPDNPPPDESPILTLAGKPILHRRNLLAVIAPQKSGKTSSMSAMIASIMGPEGRDYLGFQGFNPHGHAVRYFDTEQSKRDFHHMSARALRRAGTAIPKWFAALHLKSFSPKERRAIVFAEIKDAAANGGLLLAVIDGVADLVEDFNDLREASCFVAELSALTETCNCSIACTLHVNPSPKGQQGDKARGHLGTILEQKAETIIHLTKEKGALGEAFTIATKDARHGGVEEPPRFAWDDASKMHRTMVNAFATRPDPKRADLKTVAQDVLGASKPLPYLALQKGIQDARGVSTSTADRRIKEMVAARIISREEGGFYRLAGEDEKLDEL